MIHNRGWIINCEDLTASLIDALAGAHINELGIHPGGGKKAGELLDNALVLYDKPETRELYRYAAQKGIAVEYDIHALCRLLPRTAFDEHPEWFRLDENGQRNPDSNMCPSNAAALQVVTENSRRLALKLKTNTHRYAFWPDDVASRHCRCEKCAAFTPAEQALLITNAIQKGLRQADPEAITGYLAYQDTMTLPQKVQPEEGIYLEYAPIKRNSDRPINDPDCPENRGETAPLIPLLDFFGRKNSRVLEYWVDNSRFSNWTRPPKPMTLNEEVMKKDVEYYASLGFEDMTSFACFLGPDYIALYGEPPVKEYGDILYQQGETE